MNKKIYILRVNQKMSIATRGMQFHCDAWRPCAPRVQLSLQGHSWAEVY